MKWLAATALRHLDPLQSGFAVKDVAGHADPRALWMEQAKTHDKNWRVLLNAASFLAPTDRGQAIELASKAQAVQPDEPRMAEKLGELHSLQKSHSEVVDHAVEVRAAQVLKRRLIAVPLVRIRSL